jgi:hypothetical protein
VIECMAYPLSPSPSLSLALSLSLPLSPYTVLLSPGTIPSAHKKARPGVIPGAGFLSSDPTLMLPECPPPRLLPASV